MVEHRTLRDATEILPTGLASGTWNGNDAVLEGSIARIDRLSRGAHGAPRPILTVPVHIPEPSPTRKGRSDERKPAGHRA